jgi:hypothetical protein
VDDRARLPLCDLAPLAVFLCGARWQTALARLVHRDPRLIRRYVAGGAPISAAVSRRITELVCAKHGNQMRWIRASYLDMLGSLSSSPFRAGLLAMDGGRPAAPPPAGDRGVDATFRSSRLPRGS